MKIHIWVNEKNLGKMIEWIKLFEEGNHLIIDPPYFDTYMPGINYIELDITYDVFVALKDHERKQQ